MFIKISTLLFTNFVVHKNLCECVENDGRGFVRLRRLHGYVTYLLNTSSFNFKINTTYAYEVNWSS